MAIKRFKSKIRAYYTYARSGEYKERYHRTDFRVLTVCTSHRRLENLKKATEEAGGKKRFWFACLSDLTPKNALTTPVWSVASTEQRSALMTFSK